MPTHRNPVKKRSVIPDARSGIRRPGIAERLPLGPEGATLGAAGEGRLLIFRPSAGFEVLDVADPRSPRRVTTLAPAPAQARPAAVPSRRRPRHRPIATVPTLVLAVGALYCLLPVFWVFAAATTNVEYTITVTDTQEQQVKTYFNPLGTPAQPIQDTAAFATCP